MRITAELIARAPVFVNPLKDREIDLRGNKIALIENIGTTQDQFDTIELSDNEITKFDNFPVCNRLRTILLNNNRISRIGSKLGESLPALETLILTNNRLANLRDLDPLADLASSLTVLCLLDNPVTQKHQYRQYVIRLLPRLRLLDFRKIKLKERKAAEELFTSDAANKAKTFVPGEGFSDPFSKEKQAIKAAIDSTHTIADLSQLENFLSTGATPIAPEPALTTQTMSESMSGHPTHTNGSDSGDGDYSSMLQ